VAPPWFTAAMNQIRQRFDDVEERLEDRFNDAEVDRDDIRNMLSQLQRQTLLVCLGYLLIVIRASIANATTV
jgi:hypothetical protein